MKALMNKAVRMRLCACILLIFIVSGCGYQPVSRYADEIFKNGVYVDISIYPAVPEASTGIKDSINNAIIKRFQGQLVDKAQSHARLKIDVVSITNSPIAYNKDGFVSHYRTNIVLGIYFENNDGVKFNVVNSGYYDYNADFTSTIVLDQYYFDSISSAALQALDKFVSQVAYYGSYK